MAVVAFAIAIAGFAPALLDTASRTDALTAAVALHGALFTAWLLLLITQTVLVSQRRVAIHRRTGYVGAALAALMVVSGYLAAIAMARRGHDLSGDLIRGPNDSAVQVLVFQLGDLLTFAILVALAVAYRRRPQIHKRFMLFATLGALMPAALAHVIGHWSVLRQAPAPIILLPIAALLAAPVVHDRMSRGRVHPLSLSLALGIFVWAIVRAAVIGPSDAWHDMAAWLVR
jgi:hypothetical protein